MLNIADTLHHWCREERPFSLATTVDDAVAFNPGFVPGTGLARNAGPSCSNSCTVRMRRASANCGCVSGGAETSGTTD